jgi:hypothetical protein
MRKETQTMKLWKRIAAGIAAVAFGIAGFSVAVDAQTFTNFFNSVAIGGGYGGTGGGADIDEDGNIRSDGNFTVDDITAENIVADDIETETLNVNAASELTLPITITDTTPDPDEIGMSVFHEPISEKTFAATNGSMAVLETLESPPDKLVLITLNGPATDPTSDLAPRVTGMDVDTGYGFDLSARSTGAQLDVLDAADASLLSIVNSASGATREVNVEIEGNLSIGTGGDGASSGNSFFVSGAASQTRNIAFQTAGVNRWIMRANNATESGSNVGSNFVIDRRADDGSAIETALTITRSTGNVVVAKDFSAANVLSGTYTPTITNIGGLSSISTQQFSYMRVGAVVTVQGQFTATNTVGGGSANIPLPIASNFTSTNEASGTGWTLGTSATEMNICGIDSDSSGDDVNMTADPNMSAGTGRVYHVHFTYQIL